MGVAIQLGCDCRPRPGLGEDSVQVDLDKTPFWNTRDQLIWMRQTLDELSSRMRADPAVAAAIGHDVIRMEETYGDLSSRWQQIYAAIFGESDTGVGAIVWTLPWVVAAMFALATLVYAAVLALREILQRRDAAPSAPSAPGAPPAPEADWEKKFKAWLESNWGYVAAGLAALIGINLVSRRR